MEYDDLVERFVDLEATASTDEKTAILADLFRSADEDDLPRLVTLVRGDVFVAWQSDELGVSSSLTRRAIAKATGVPEDELEEWWREAGDLGDAARRAVEHRRQRTLASHTLSVAEVHETLEAVAGYEGEGSQTRRVDAIAELIANAAPEEARFVVRTVVGAMRLGVGEGTIRDAIAAAFLDGSDGAIDAVEEAYEVTNDFRVVAETARDGGRDALADLDVEVFRPIKPMLAQDGEDPETALETITEAGGEALLEVKYDGMRAKLHVDGHEVRVFTRRLEDVTAQFPDVVDAVEDHVAADTAIIEAEVVGTDPETGEVLPFQQLSRRIKREHDIEAMAEAIPVTVYVFDLLYLDSESLLDNRLQDRLSSLTSITDTTPGVLERAEHRVPETAEDVEAFYESALAAGHEGVMVKNLAATYQPGSRVGYTLKLKPTMEPLDLVITRAKWSEGRKSDFLGRPYLACRDPETGELLEVGRMHTGFTDEELEGLTDRLEPLITDVDGREATVRPEVVIEVEYEEIQSSPTYDSGFALRFPRFSRFRDELDPGDADTLDRVRSLYESQSG